MNKNKRGEEERKKEEKTQRWKKETEGYRKKLD